MKVCTTCTFVAALWSPVVVAFAPIASTLLRSPCVKSVGKIWSPTIPSGMMATSSNGSMMSSKDTTSDEPVFVSKYLDQESKYNEVLNFESGTPFSVDTGKGLVWYCLSAKVDAEKVSEIAGEMHNCRHCKLRVSKSAGYFGSDGYIVDFGGIKNGGPLYSQIERERPILTNAAVLDSKGTLIVSQENLDKYPRVLGTDPDTGNPFYHLGLNYPPESHHITSPALASTLTPALLAKLWNGSMDGRLYEIVTMLQRKDDITGRTDLDEIKRIAETDEVLRKEFWGYRIKAVDEIQKFARKFENGDKDWELMSDIDKMHVRMFALLYGGEFSDGENPIFKAAGHVVDISNTVEGIASIPGFMNQRSNPSYYMVQQVARKNAENSVRAPFIASLSWESNSDLDGHIYMLDATNQHVYYGNMKSYDGETYLNFDANAGSPTTEPVETFTFSSKSPGTYEFKVNNFNTRDNEKTIPFTVVVSLNGETKTFDDCWDCRTKRENSRNDRSEMIDICTVEITQEMIDSFRATPELSTRQANRLGQLLPEYTEKFGNITTQIADMSTMEGSISIHRNTGNCISVEDDGAEAKLKELASLILEANQKKSPPTTNVSRNRKTLGSRSGPSLNTFDDILRSLQADPRSVSIQVRGRNYYPSTITTHSCSEGQLKTNTIVNSYIEEGKPPVQPDPTLQETCRFEKEWSSDFAATLRATSVLPVKHMFYDGFFLSLENTHLPLVSDTTWCVGAGMYPTDLSNDNRKFREIWATLHSSVRPTVADTNVLPAIGVFLHRGKTYELMVNGVEYSVTI